MTMTVDQQGHDKFSSHIDGCSVSGNGFADGADLIFSDDYAGVHLDGAAGAVDNRYMLQHREMLAEEEGRQQERGNGEEVVAFHSVKLGVPLKKPIANTLYSQSGIVVIVWKSVLWLMGLDPHKGLEGSAGFCIGELLLVDALAYLQGLVIMACLFQQGGIKVLVGDLIGGIDAFDTR